MVISICCKRFLYCTENDEETDIDRNGDAGDGVTYAAFVNPDGSYGLVVSNRGEAKQVNIQIAGKPAFVANLPANGVVSYLISPVFRNGVSQIGG